MHLCQIFFSEPPRLIDVAAASDAVKARKKELAWVHERYLENPVIVSEDDSSPEIDTSRESNEFDKSKSPLEESKEEISP